MNPNEPSKVTFESEQWQPPTRSVQSRTPKIVQWIITYSGGYVKDEKQAAYVLIGFFILAIIFSFMLFGSLNQTTPPSQLPYKSDSTIIDDDAIQNSQLP